MVSNEPSDGSHLHEGGREPSGAIDRDFDESAKTPEFHREIKVNDVCLDLQTRQVVYVVGRTAATVRDHAAEEGFDLSTYKAHPYLPVTDDDPVFECVFVPGSPDDLPHPDRSLKTYDFPRGRLARIAVECATDDGLRPQERFVRAAIASLVASVDEAVDRVDSNQAPDQIRRWVADVARVSFGEDVVEAALTDAGFDADLDQSGLEAWGESESTDGGEQE